MSKFRFRLEVIRQLRQRAQDTQRRMVADRIRELDVIAERDNGLRQLIEEADDGKRMVLSRGGIVSRRLPEPARDAGGRGRRDHEGSAQAKARGSALDIELLRRHQLYRGWLDQTAVDAGAEMHRHQELLDRERAKLAEVSRRLKVIEELRERQWKRHQKQCQRAEQTAFDEVALQGYLRRRDNQSL